MTFKAFVQFGIPRLVREKVRNTFILTFNQKTGKHGLYNLIMAEEQGLPKGWKEVEFETSHQAYEFIRTHPDVNHSLIRFVGNKETLTIGKRWKGKDA